MATITESKEAVLRVMRGEDPEKVLDGLLEQPVDQVDQDGPHKPTIEDYGPEELEQMQQSASDAMVKMEAVYGNMLKHDRNAAEACEECMEEMRTAAERCQTDPIEGAYEMHKSMAEMCDALGDDAYEGSDDDTSDIQTVMGEMVDVYEEFNIKLGGSDPNVDQGDDGEVSPGQPGGGVKVDVSGIPAGRGSRSEQDDDDEMEPEDDEVEPDEEEPDERHRPGHEDDDYEEPEAELGMDDEEPEPEDDDMPPDEPMGDEEPAEQGKECPVCGQQMEYSEEAGMEQCGECGYEAAHEMNTHDDEEMPAEDPGMEEPEPDEQNAEPEDGEEDDELEPDDDEEEEPAMEARKCPHCRQPMKEDTQRGKNVCTFCKFELDLGA